MLSKGRTQVVSRLIRVEKIFIKITCLKRYAVQFYPLTFRAFGGFCIHKKILRYKGYEQTPSKHDTELPNISEGA